MIRYRFGRICYSLPRTCVGHLDTCPCLRGLYARSRYAAAPDATGAFAGGMAARCHVHTTYLPYCNHPRGLPAAVKRLVTTGFSYLLGLLVVGVEQLFIGDLDVGMEEYCSPLFCLLPCSPILPVVLVLCQWWLTIVLLMPTMPGNCCVDV